MTVVSEQSARPEELDMFVRLKRQEKQIKDALEQLRPVVLPLLRSGTYPDIEVRTSTRTSFLDDVAVALLDAFLKAKKLTKPQYEQCFERAVSQNGIKKLISDGIISADEFAPMVKETSSEAIYLR